LFLVSFLFSVSLFTVSLFSVSLLSGSRGHSGATTLNDYNDDDDDDELLTLQTSKR